MADDLQLPILAPETTSGFVVPAIVADTHRDASERFLEYFAATIRNANTRAAYMNAVADFLRFEPVADLGSLAEIRSIHVSAYIESIGERFAPQTVKQRLAALRGLFGSGPRLAALVRKFADSAASDLAAMRAAPDARGLAAAGFANLEPATFRKTPRNKFDPAQSSPARS